MTRLVVAGSGTVVPEAYRGCSSYYVESGEARALLDCGPGTVGSLERFDLPWPSLTHLVLTHFHADHVGDLPGLFFALKHAVFPAREEPLQVWGPPGTVEVFRGLASVLGDYFTDPGFPVDVGDVEPGETRRLADEVELSTCRTPHTDQSMALRIAAREGSVGYTGDTGPSDEVAAFMERTDVLVCECSLLDEEVGDNHLSPERAARMAQAAGPELLVLTHVYPHVRAEHDVGALVAAAGYDGQVAVAQDGDTFRLPLA